MRGLLPAFALCFSTSCGDIVLGSFEETGDAGQSTPRAMAIIVGDDRLRALSLDAGLSWENEQSDGPDPNLVLHAVSFGDGQFVAVGGEWSSRIERSVDGVNWEIVSQGDGAGLRDVTYTGERWIAVGMGGEIMKSDDAVTWERELVPLENTKLASVASDGDQLLLAVGDGDVVGSFDGGQTWLHKFSDGLVHVAVAYGDAFVVADLDGQVHVSASNLADWVEDVDIAPKLDDLIYAQGRYWAVGGTQLSVSEDALTWQSLALDGAMEAVAYGEGVFVGVGANTRFRSLDGFAWNPVAVAAPGHAVVVAPIE